MVRGLGLGVTTSQQFPAPWEVWSAFTALGLVISIAVGLVTGIVSGLFQLGDS